ncbi:MAG: transcription elongation factor GreA [bacterium]|jgi:transcription elongation factor GreA|nr:transcription elongation factor GreA [bacterium]
MNRVYLTKEGYEKIRSELVRLQTEDRPHVIAAIKKAREFGDLSENAEYHAAKERQAFLENKIAGLQIKLTHSEIIDESQIPKDKVYLGATVKMKDLKTGKEIQYKLVSTDEVDIAENKISTGSPIGQALLGKAVADVVEITVPVGLLTYEILDISRG